MPYLFLMGELGADRIVPVDGESFVIGRDEGCDLRVLDVRVSRRHAVLRHGSEGWVVEDLESRNGITVNQVKLRSAALSSGDVLGVGPLSMRFEAGTLGEQEASVLDRSAVDTVLAGQTMAGGLAEAESQRRLRLILEISTALDSFGSPESLLSRFGELVVTLFSPSRCIVAVGGERWCFDGREGRIGGADLEDVSRTVVSRVRERGEALVVRDVLDEPMVQIDLGTPRPASGFSPCTVQSAKFRGIRSAMGAPIFTGDRVVGLIYVDHRRQGDRPLGQEDLCLLISVGRLISAAVNGSLRFARLLVENRFQQSASHGPGIVVGDSPAMVALRETIESRVGPVRTTVLLTGETGTGKSMVAQAIHLASPRNGGPFIKVNCAAIPKELLESELFGYEKGAFSGANRRKLGLFEAADGGTLFLDEVGELDHAAQAKLLTVLQDRQIFRLGASQPVDIDVRLVAATNRDLKQEVQDGRFRADLYYRLNVVTLTIPPLRERREDIGPLADHLLHRACREIGRTLAGISPEAMERLREYDWPGNVRELANCLERAVIFGDPGEPLGLEHLPVELQEAMPPDQVLPPVEESEREIISKALQLAQGNKRQAARLLGWYPQKLYHRLKRYGIEV